MGRQSESRYQYVAASFWESIKRKAKHANFHGSESGKAVKEVYKPIRKTLRPVVQDSVEDSTGNLYIEGDNLDVLKLLQESYLRFGKSNLYRSAL